jgi:hypothetical protein
MTLKQTVDYYNKFYSILRSGNETLKLAVKIWDEWERDDLKRLDIKKYQKIIIL